MPVPTPIPPSSPRFSIRTKPTVPLDAMTAAFKASTLTHLASPSPLSLAPTPIPAPPYTSARPDVHIHLAHPSTNDAEEEGCGCDPITDESSDSPASRARALAQGSVAPAPSGGFFPPPDPSKTHPENTTVFIGGLPPSVSRAELGGMFEAFGEVIYINIPPGRGCGFVSYDNRQAAEWAIERMQGFWLRGAQLRLAWGRIQGDKPKPKSTTSNASDLSNNIKADLPFFAKMLDLSAEQQVKLGLYLEFANTGSLGRLKDILGVVSPINDTPTSSTDSALGLALGSAQAASLASLPETTSEPARRQSSTRQLPSLSEHVDRLVDSPSSSSIPSLAHTGSTHPYPTRTYHTHQHPSIDMLPTPAESPSPKVSDSSASASVSVSQSFGPPSIADEAVFRAFHPTALDHEAQNRRYQSQQSQAHEHGQEHGVGQAHHHHHHGHHHQHGENCVTPMSLQKLAQMQAVQDQVSYPISSSYGGSNGVPVGPSVNRQGFQGDAPPSIPTSGAAGAREFVPSAAYQAGPAAQHNALQPGMGYAGAAMPSAGGGYGRQAAAPQMNAKAWDWMPGDRWGAGRSAAAAGGYGSGRW